MVFWSDWGPNAKIESSYMDGSERTAITNDGIYWPNGLALDFATDRIYWADAKHHVIESSKLDGADRKKILSNNLPHPFALTIFEDNMYWTDWHTKTISSANKVTGKNFRHVHEGLHFPMDIHSYHKARQPKFVNRCVEDKRRLKGGCSHLCLPNRTSRRCACPIGLTLLEDQKTCTSVPDKILLIARKKDIRMRQLDSKNPHEIDMVIPLDNLKSTLALDWCSDTDRIYWTDTGKSTISRAYLNGSNQETIIADGLVSPTGLALDWITNKFYWTDSGTNRIEVSTLNGVQRALLVWENLLKPLDIVVNPIQGLMFWSDWSETPLIERASMDGSERLSIISENLFHPNGLTIDYSNNRLYFVDAGTKVLEFVNFDGTGRNRLITDNIQHPFGIDVFEKSIFWSDWETQGILVVDKHSGKNRRYLVSNTSDLMDIRVFHRKRQQRFNPCSVRNGGCSHMCLLNSKDPFYSCACPIGVKLKEDGRSCKDQPTKYILFAHGTDIRQVSLDIDYMIDVVLPLPRIGTVFTLDVDLHTGDIYWADIEEDKISRSSSSGRNVVTILSESMEGVCGLVICSISRKIYFTDEERRSVEVCELDGSNRRVLFWQDLEKPRAIAINYESGYLFFSDWGSTPRIERAVMDGAGRTRIITSKLIWPNGLTVDKSKKHLYWTDAKVSKTFLNRISIISHTLFLLIISFI
jgi:low-density lipoprotein receptor-related protein 4